MLYRICITLYGIQKYDKYSYHKYSIKYTVMKLFLYRDAKIKHLSYLIGFFLFLYLWM